MKEAIDIGYYRLNIHRGSDQQQVDRIVGEFTKGFDAAVASASISATDREIAETLDTGHIPQTDKSI